MSTVVRRSSGEKSRKGKRAWGMELSGWRLASGLEGLRPGGRSAQIRFANLRFRLEAERNDAEKG